MLKTSEKEKVFTGNIDNLKALPKKGNGVSMNPYPKV